MQCPFLELIADSLSAADCFVVNETPDSEVLQQPNFCRPKKPESVDEFLFGYVPDQKSVEDFLATSEIADSESNLSQESNKRQDIYTEGSEPTGINRPCTAATCEVQKPVSPLSGDKTKSRKRKPDQKPKSQGLSEEEREQRRRDQNREAQRRFRERQYFSNPTNSSFNYNLQN